LDGGTTAGVADVRPLPCHCRAVAANLLASWLRLGPPPCWPGSGRGSALRSSAPRHIPPEDYRPAPSGSAPTR
jgi:hypothetical protein